VYSLKSNAARDLIIRTCTCRLWTMECSTTVLTTYLFRKDFLYLSLIGPDQVHVLYYFSQCRIKWTIYLHHNSLPEESTSQVLSPIQTLNINIYFLFLLLSHLTTKEIVCIEILTKTIAMIPLLPGLTQYPRYAACFIIIILRSTTTVGY
jgi:hypothetical protein